MSKIANFFACLFGHDWYYGELQYVPFTPIPFIPWVNYIHHECIRTCGKCGKKQLVTRPNQNENWKVK